MRRPFLVIDGAAPAGKPKSSELVRCPVCSGNAMIEVRLGMVRAHPKARASGGQKQVCCAVCLAQGRITTVDF